MTEVAARDLQDQYEQLIQEDPVSRKSQLERMFRVSSSEHFPLQILCRCLGVDGRVRKYSNAA